MSRCFGPFQPRTQHTDDKLSKLNGGPRHSFCSVPGARSQIVAKLQFPIGKWNWFLVVRAAVAFGPASWLAPFQPNQN